MADSVWGRQPAMYAANPALVKRPRTEYDLTPQMATGLEIHNRGGPHATNDPKNLGSAYDPYLQRAEVQPYTSAEATVLSAASLGRGIPMGDPSLLTRPGSVVPGGASNGRDGVYGGQLVVNTMARPGREPAPLPSDASNTLYVEGLPPNSSKREVAHIFRPFVGYKEVRLVTKESKRRGGDPLILCFVDFIDAPCAATALNALQGYRMDQDDRDSAYLRLQFSRHPGPRSGHGSRGRKK